MNLGEAHSLSDKSIVILCHRRTRHLEQVLIALEKCEGAANFTTVFVIQDPTEPVLEIIRHFPHPFISLKIDGSSYNSSAQAINGNLFTGLEFCFTQLKSSYVVVLEDDIVLSKDALFYFESTIRLNGDNPSFRGVNAFSETICDSALQNAYVRTNYGLGWGWAIHSSIYSKILKFWKGTEDNHWDFILEPYLRTGFVINPLRSRALNIGFDESATHTSGNQEIGVRMFESFNSPMEEVVGQYMEVQHDFFWMGKKINYSNVDVFQFACRRLIYFSFLLLGNSKLYHRIRRLLTPDI